MTQIAHVVKGRATEVSRDCQADEWAIRQGTAIAKRHMPDAPFSAYSALACDIADALQSAFDQHVK